MVDTISPATYEQIVTLLTQLHTNYSNLASTFYDVFYNKTPKEVTFKMFDESNNYVDYTVKNLALSNQYRAIGNESPENNVSAVQGTLYQDLNNGEVYIKHYGDTNEGWSKLVNQALLDGYIIHGNVNPNGFEKDGVIIGKVDATPGTLYVNTDTATLYICVQEGTWVVISASVGGFATTSLDNITDDGNNVIKEIVTEQIGTKTNYISNSSTDSQVPSAKAVYEYVNPQINKIGNLETSVTNIQTNKQDKSNLVTSISSSSTDTQYPSAKCVYDLVGNLEDKINNL